MRTPSLGSAYVLSGLLLHVLRTPADFRDRQGGALFQSGVPCKIASLWLCSALSLANQRFYRDEHLLVDLRQQLVMLDGATVSLTRMQYHLLVLLVEHAGEVLPPGGSLEACLGRSARDAQSHPECAGSGAAEKTRSIRLSVYRNDYESRIPFPARARALGLKKLFHGKSHLNGLMNHGIKLSQTVLTAALGEFCF